MTREALEKPIVKPIERTLVLRKVHDLEEQAEKFINLLKSIGVYRQDLLYSGFDKSNPSMDSSSVFCVPEAELHREYDEYGAPTDLNPFSYADNPDYNAPAIAIYDPNLLTDDPGPNRWLDRAPHKYFPRPGFGLEQALIAVIKIKF